MPRSGEIFENRSANWSFSYVKSPLCEIRTRKKDTCGGFFKSSVVPHISFRLTFVCELKKIHANQLVTERGQWSGETASLILGARALRGARL